MNQEKKKVIAAKLKEIMPKDWKYSLSVYDYSAIVMTISSAPVDLLANIDWNKKPESYISNVSYRTLEKCFEGEVQQLMTKIIDILNTDNHNNSDSQTDYFDVGHYVDLSIGKYDKPFMQKIAA